MYDRIRAVERGPGRAPIDPKILMALWLSATIEGIGSVRYRDELCRDHAAFPWLAGDVSTNYHSLADFRTDHVALLDDLLTKSVATLMAEGLIELNRVAQERDAGPGQCRGRVIPTAADPGGGVGPGSRAGRDAA